MNHLEGIDALLEGDYVIIRLGISDINLDHIVRDCESPSHPMNLYTPSNDKMYSYVRNTKPITTSLPDVTYSPESLVCDIKRKYRPLGMYHVNDELICCFNHGYVYGGTIHDILYNRGIRSQITTHSMPLPHILMSAVNPIAGPIAIATATGYQFDYSVSETTHRLEFSTPHNVSSRTKIRDILSVVCDTFGRQYIPVRFITSCGTNQRFNRTSFCDKIVTVGNTVDLTTLDWMVSNSISNIINTIPYKVIQGLSSSTPESTVYISIVNCRMEGVMEGVMVTSMKMDSVLEPKNDSTRLLNVTCMLTEAATHYSLAIRNDALYKSLCASDIFK